MLVTRLWKSARSRFPLPAGLIAAAAFVLLVVGGCKQGEGEVCQVDNDCEVGLLCNATTQRCQASGGSTPTADAGPTVDAPQADAEVDATPDAGADAAADAMP